MERKMDLSERSYIEYEFLRNYVNAYMDDTQDLIDEAYEDETGRYDDKYISYQTGRVDALWEVLKVITSLTPFTVDDILNNSSLPIPKDETFDVYEDNGLVTMSLDTLKKLLMDEEFRENLLPVLVRCEIAMESKKFGYPLHNKEVN